MLAALNAAGFAYFMLARTTFSRWIVTLILTLIALAFAGSLTFFSVIAFSDDALIVVENQDAVLRSSMAWAFGFILLEIACIIWFRRVARAST
ncbi:hypothetical protein NBRC116588_13470 [Pyruvatibacter sp. HU-CL02332]